VPEKYLQNIWLHSKQKPDKNYGNKYHQLLIYSPKVVKSMCQKMRIWNITLI